ncbi:MAG: hypothetical protein DHS20C21_00620 [Gemmatimonadota bacterium]|nr:MAG: hypothetical protein DHS20C21_00620 [Gemmatimonadota bacterium]
MSPPIHRPSSRLPDHWALAPFDLLFRNVTSSALKLPKGEYVQGGRYAVIDQGADHIGGFTNDKSLVHPGPVPSIVFGDHTRCVKFAERPFVQGADGVKVLAPSPSIDAKYAYWALKNAEIPDRGYARHFSLLRKVALPLAPTGEQHRIVEAIESYFTRLDDAVANLERVQRNLKRYRASVLKAAVEGRLVPTEAELARAEGRDYEPASVLLERILAERRRRWDEAELAKMKAKGKAPKDDKWKAKYKEPAIVDTAALGALPAGWCWASIDQILENHDKDRVPVKRADRAKRRGDYPYYGASGAIDSIDDFLFDGSYVLVGEDGANLLARSSPIAFQARGRFWVNNHAHVFQTYLGLPLEYVESFFNATDLARFVTGTAQPKLPQTAMNKIPVPIPPAAEQVRIGDEVERLLSIARDVETSVAAATRKCQRLRRSTLKWAFEGRLVGQCPEDEPATELLQHIKAEGEGAGGEPRSRRKPRRTTKGPSA